MAGLFDPLNPLQGLQNIPGVNQIDGADSFVTSGQVTGFAENAIPSLLRGDNPLLSVGLGGLGAIKGGQTAASGLANIAKTRQDLVKGGLDITESGLNIQQKDLDLGIKKQSRNALMAYIYNLPDKQKLLALANPEKFVDAMMASYKPTGTITEYNLAKAEGYQGSWTDYMRDIEKYRTPSYNIVNKMPEKDKMFLEARMKTAENLVGQADTARLIASQTADIENILSGLKGGGVEDLSAQAQAFLGIDTDKATARQVAEAIRTKAAPLVRTPGSGSTSDMEFRAYLNSFPSLAMTPEGRKIMVEMTRLYAERQAKLADWTMDRLENNSFRYEELAKYDDSLGKIISKDMANAINKLRKDKNLPPIIMKMKESQNTVYGEKR